MSAATQIALEYALSAGGMSPRSPEMFVYTELTYYGQRPSKFYKKHEL